MDPIEAAVLSAVKSGCDSLRHSVQNVYWPPANPVNEFSERHVSHYVGQQLSRKGYSVFLEAHFPDGADRRLDMLAVHPTKRVSVAIEAKRFYTVEQAASIAIDVERVREFRVSHHYYQHDPPTHRLGLILATTWNPGFADWWADSDRPALPGRARAAGWNPLRRALGQALVTGSMPLATNVDEQREQFAVWALYG